MSSAPSKNHDPELPEQNTSAQTKTAKTKGEEFFKKLLEYWSQKGMPAKIMPSRERPAFPDPVPKEFPKGDRRFEVKRQRVFVCDKCHRRVPYSGKINNPGGRTRIDFAGSYVNHDWTMIPGEMQKEAWSAGVIDATWHCHAGCGADVTYGDVDKRMIRARAPHEEMNNDTCLCQRETIPLSFFPTPRNIL